MIGENVHIFPTWSPIELPYSHHSIIRSLLIFGLSKLCLPCGFLPRNISGSAHHVVQSFFMIYMRLLSIFILHMDLNVINQLIFIQINRFLCLVNTVKNNTGMHQGAMYTVWHTIVYRRNKNMIFSFFCFRKKYLKTNKT